MYKTHSDLKEFKEDVVLKIIKLKDLVDNMSQDDFNKFYFNNISFHRLIQFIDKDLHKVFDDLLKDAMYELKTEKVIDQKFKEFKMSDREMEEYDRLQFELFKLKKQRVEQ